MARDGVLLGRIGRTYRSLRLLQKAAGRLPGRKKAAQKRRLAGGKALKAAGLVLLFRQAGTVKKKGAPVIRILKLVTDKRIRKLAKKILLTPRG